MTRRLSVLLSVVMVVLAASVVALAAGDPTPDPPPRIAFVARADGTNVVDALAVGGLAGQLAAPVFTTPGTRLAEDAAAGLVAHQPELVVIAGGPAAISLDVESAIEGVTGLSDDQVVRAAGDDRYGTAAALATLLEDLGIDAAFLPVGATAVDSQAVGGYAADALVRSAAAGSTELYTSGPDPALQVDIVAPSRGFLLIDAYGKLLNTSDATATAFCSYSIDGVPPAEDVNPGVSIGTTYGPVATCPVVARAVVEPGTHTVAFLFDRNASSTQMVDRALNVLFVPFGSGVLQRAP